jgi:hypothetical protein
MARTLQLELMPVWSEAAPPAPLRGHFFLCAAEWAARHPRQRDRSPSQDVDARPRIPHDDVVAVENGGEPPLVAA